MEVKKLKNDMTTLSALFENQGYEQNSNAREENQNRKEKMLIEMLEEKEKRIEMLNKEKGMLEKRMKILEEREEMSIKEVKVFEKRVDKNARKKMSKKEEMLISEAKELEKGMEGVDKNTREEMLLSGAKKLEKGVKVMNDNTKEKKLSEVENISSNFLESLSNIDILLVLSIVLLNFSGLSPLIVLICILCKNRHVLAKSCTLLKFKTDNLIYHLSQKLQKSKIRFKIRSRRYKALRKRFKTLLHLVFIAYNNIKNFLYLISFP